MRSFRWLVVFVSSVAQENLLIFFDNAREFVAIYDMVEQTLAFYCFVENRLNEFLGFLVGQKLQL